MSTREPAIPAQDDRAGGEDGADPRGREGATSAEAEAGRGGRPVLAAPRRGEEDRQRRSDRQDEAGPREVARRGVVGDRVGQRAARAAAAWAR